MQQAGGRHEPRDAAAARKSREAQLLAALRRGDSHAAESVWLYYAARLFDIAAGFHIPDAERQGLAFDFLGGLLPKLARSNGVPQSLTAYVIVSFGHYLIDRERSEELRREREAEACEDLPGENECAAVGCCSEYSLRACKDPAAETDQPRKVLVDLYRFVNAGLRADDRVLLAYRAHRGSLSEIAAEMGMTYGAAKSRMHRVRERSLRLAREFARTRPAAERAEVERFLGRSGLSSPEDDADE